MALSTLIGPIHVACKPAAPVYDLDEAGCSSLFVGLLSPDVLTLDRAPFLDQDGAPQATLNWHVSDAFVDGRGVGIMGSTGLLTKGDGSRLGETRLRKVQRKQDGAAQQPALPAPSQEPALQMPAGAERRHVAAQPPAPH